MRLLLSTRQIRDEEEEYIWIFWGNCGGVGKAATTGGRATTAKRGWSAIATGPRAFDFSFLFLFFLKYYEHEVFYCNLVSFS